MTEAAQPRSILVLLGRYHIMSNASIVNNCILILLLLYSCYLLQINTANPISNENTIGAVRSNRIPLVSCIAITPALLVTPTLTVYMAPDIRCRSVLSYNDFGSAAECSSHSKLSEK